MQDDVVVEAVAFHAVAGALIGVSHKIATAVFVDGADDFVPYRSSLAACRAELEAALCPPVMHRLRDAARGYLDAVEAIFDQWEPILVAAFDLAVDDATAKAIISDPIAVNEPIRLLRDAQIAWRVAEGRFAFRGGKK